MDIYNFKPTYLYIKQHSITGLKYFGKTIKDPYTYLGSGKYWERHIKKHGKEFVETIWVSELYYDSTKLKEDALEFSYKNDIVNSKDWANLILENGINGGDSSHLIDYKKVEETRKRNNKTWNQSEHSNLKRSISHKGKKLTPESIQKGIETKRNNGSLKLKEDHKKKISLSCKGINTGPRNPEQKVNMTFNKNNSIKISCPYCGKQGQLTNMKSRHIPYCKLNPNKIERPLITCSVCGHQAIDSANFRRYHNQNCKL